MRVITITNQKGGVGKTIISFHLAKYLGGGGEEVVFYKKVAAEDGKKKKSVVALQRKLPNFKVLYIDSDGQGNGSSVFPEECFTGTYTFDLFAENKEIIPSKNSVTVVKGDQRMTDIHNLDGQTAGNLFFANMLKCDEIFDYVIIDSPPTENVAVRSIMLVTDYVLSPIIPVQFSIDGIPKVLKLVYGSKERTDDMQKKHKQKNPNAPEIPFGKLNFLGIVVSKIMGSVAKVNAKDSAASVRLKSQELNLEALGRHYGKLMLLSAEGTFIGISERPTVEVAVSQKGAVWQNEGVDALASTQEFFSVFDAIEHKIGGF